MPTIKNWYKVHLGSGDYLVGGQIYDHPKFPDGESIKTSLVTRQHKNTILTRSGSKYVLEGDELVFEDIPKLHK